MAWRRLDIDENFQVADPAYISVLGKRFNFSNAFARKADILKMTRVQLFVEDDLRQIGFHFHDDKSDVQSIKLGRKAGRKRPSMHCTAAKASKECPWIAEAAKAAKKDKKFIPELQNIPDSSGKMWVIKLRPSFDMRVNRSEIYKISVDAYGIYRYVADDDEIVYIGIGKIRERAKVEERAGWKFVRIEYCIVRDENEQKKWEYRYLEEFKAAHGGRLPFYNKNSGQVIVDSPIAVLKSTE